MSRILQRVLRSARGWAGTSGRRSQNAGEFRHHCVLPPAIPQRKNIGRCALGTFVTGIAIASIGWAQSPAREARFSQAEPVWLEGRETEMNVTAGFRAIIDCPATEKLTARLTAASIYRLYVNGEFVGHGPARAAHGDFRIDEWPLSPHLREGTNVVAVEVTSYNANSYYLLDQPGFLAAEVVTGEGKVVAATGVQTNHSFAGRAIPSRVQKVRRYSLQRPFLEAYRLAPGQDAWRTEATAEFSPDRLIITAPKQYLIRGVPYSTFDVVSATALVSRGSLRGPQPPSQVYRGYTPTDLGPRVKAFPEEEFEVTPLVDLQQFQNGTVESPADRSLESNQRFVLQGPSFHLFRFKANLTGFLGTTLTCTSPSRVILSFDEVLTGATDDDPGEIDLRRYSCANVIDLHLEPGTYRFESVEPYTLQYVKVNVLEGSVTFSVPQLREYAHPASEVAQFAASDPRLGQIFEAARQTFRQNVVDIFMDCPGRERAGWLCDSYFTARAAFDFTGQTAVERNFLENYLRPERYPYLPAGMLPMCYPADHTNGVFIPNWSLWFVVQLPEYLARSGDRATIDALQPKVMALFDYFRSFENQDGLLEKLDSWIFIEWSKANEFVQDVNYPSNFLYAAALRAAGQLYNRPELTEKAERTLSVARDQSFDGTFFVDNAQRQEDGKLVRTRNRSEVCQYFAFYFGAASPETHAVLWETLVDDFGPERDANVSHADVHPANAFIGNTLRLELLSQHGKSPQVLKESVGYLHYMAERTGTLWENQGAYASCNHGFASHAAHVLLRDALGIVGHDVNAKRVRIMIPQIPLEWCEGLLPTESGPVRVRWEKQTPTRVQVRVALPPDYQSTIRGADGLELVVTE